MKHTFLLLLATLLATSCVKLDGESYRKYSDYVNIMEVNMPDSAFIGDDIPIVVQAGAPNGCWSGLEVHIGRSTIYDSVFGFTATGLFESTNNLCAEVLVTKDSTFHFKTDTAGIYLFIAYSAAYQPIYDTLVVSDTATSKR